MRSAVVLGLAALIAGCDGPDDRMYRSCEPNIPARAEWIVQCAAAANPKSDEEGEDLVKQCESTSEDLFCPLVMHHWDGVNWRPVSALAPEGVP